MQEVASTTTTITHFTVSPRPSGMPTYCTTTYCTHCGDQARFYNSSELSHIDQLDVALLWPPQADADR